MTRSKMAAEVEKAQPKSRVNKLCNSLKPHTNSQTLFPVMFSVSGKGRSANLT